MFEHIDKRWVDDGWAYEHRPGGTDKDRETDKQPACFPDWLTELIGTRWYKYRLYGSAGMQTESSKMIQQISADTLNNNMPNKRINAVLHRSIDSTSSVY